MIWKILFFGPHIPPSPHGCNTRKLSRTLKNSHLVSHERRNLPWFEYLQILLVGRILLGREKNAAQIVCIDLPRCAFQNLSRRCCTHILPSSSAICMGHIDIIWVD